MKIFLKYVFVMLFFAFSYNSYAENVDVSKLTPEQKHALNVVIKEMSEEKSDAPAIIKAIENIDQEKIHGWAEAGTEAGKAVGNFAKEIGVASGKFLNTFVGKATFFLVFMNYGGGKLTQFIIDCVLFLALVPFFFFFMLKIFKRFVLGVITTSKVKYNNSIMYRLLGSNEVEKETHKVSYSDRHGDNYTFWTPVAGWIIILISSILFFGSFWPEYTLG